MTSDNIQLGIKEKNKTKRSRVAKEEIKNAEAD